MSSKPQRGPSLLGISFDGLAISGIVNEFLNLAWALRGDRFRVLFDFGYDITIGRTVDLGDAFLPSWVEQIRCVGQTLPPEYTVELVEASRTRVIAGTSIAAARVYGGLCSDLAEGLAETFTREQVRLLVVENGTLPDNPLFTDALYLAINEYGSRQKLGKYVLWRDHDLMWSAEPSLYGSYPYPGVRKPHVNDHIHYLTITEWMRQRLRAWAPSTAYHVTPNRFSSTTMSPQPRHRSIRAAHNIPASAYLIARCTRIIPQKSVERDLRLVEAIQSRLAALGDRRSVFLFVTGATKEDATEFARLSELEQELSIAGQVVWGDGLLLPFSTPLIDAASQDDRFSIRDLLAEADLSSFLTTYDYEGFGNPPGEAMAMGVPFVATTYELYHEVYGSKGTIAPLLPIDRTSSPEEPIPDAFLTWTMRLLSDREYREQVVRRNLEVCERFFSLDALGRQVREIVGDALE